VALAQEFAELIRAWEEKSLTYLELFDRMTQQVWKLPAAARHAALDELSVHADEDVSRAAAECRVLLHHGELSRNLDHIRQTSPLRPGVRLALFGGYDYYATDGKPGWLNGRECYRATFLRFAARGEDVVPAGLVEFDEVIDLPGHKGRYGILLSSYGTDFVAWSQTEGNVVVYVTQALREDVSSFRFDGRVSPDPIETHATYRVE
jgi:hypothetical protein